jgi:hypothetical protein
MSAINSNSVSENSAVNNLQQIHQNENEQISVERNEDGNFLSPVRAVGRFLSSFYQHCCNASWIFFTIIAITMGPVVFETERQRQIPEVKKSSEVKNSPQ